MREREAAGSFEGEARGGDDRYAIHLAKTGIREGYRAADPDRILTFYSDDFEDMSDGVPSLSGVEAKAVLRARLTSLFSKWEVQFAPVVVEIFLFGSSAVDYGWQELTLEPKGGGSKTVRRTRYVELWKKAADGRWRIALFIDNADQRPALAEQMIDALNSKESLPDHSLRQNSDESL